MFRLYHSSITIMLHLERLFLALDSIEAQSVDLGDLVCALAVLHSVARETRVKHSMITIRIDLVRLHIGSRSAETRGEMMCQHTHYIGYLLAEFLQRIFKLLL
uniref:Secreted peptide n=1 Tax=Anopheles braziliensis TaxID=58242 RepID=A0A2M3ZL53_9DIPT